METETREYMNPQALNDLIERFDGDPKAMFFVGTAVGVIVGVAATLILVKDPGERLALGSGAGVGTTYPGSENTLVAVLKREAREVLDLVVAEVSEVVRDLWEEQKRDLRQTVRTTVRSGLPTNGVEQERVQV